MKPWLLVMVLVVSGCTELYRWPDRMNRPQAPSPSGERSSSPEAPPGHYTVRSGDTMYSIAFRHQLDFRELAAWNDIGPDYLIRPGQVLRLSPPPGGGRVIQTRPMNRIPERAPAPRRLPAPEPGPYHWNWPTEGRIVRSFGEQQSKGIDISGNIGQPVLAAAPGSVVYSGSALKGYGELIIIKHDDLRLSAYGYNRKRLVEEGDVVKGGQPIAQLGMGPAQQPILHFEIRERGKPVDPLGLLPRR